VGIAVAAIFFLGHVGRVTLIITAPLLLLGLTAPFGTTILGLVAISQIRHSGGRLYGIGLALADALLFPLLALDGLLMLICILAAGQVSHSMALGIALGVLAAVAADVAIVWLVHRQVTRPASGGAAAPAGGLAIAAIVLMGLLLVGGLAVVPLAGWLSYRSAAAPAPVVELRRFPLDNLDGLLTKSGVEIDRGNTADMQGSLKVVAAQPTTVHLFETGPLDVQNARLIYQAKVRSENLAGQAYLEMWCHFPGRGEFFSRGPPTPVIGTTNWTEVETPFLLKEGQKPDNVKLNLVIDGIGTVWIDDIRLVAEP
jgi:hypothetical protein